MSDENQGFCEGVALLLKRMKSHPEEFIGVGEEFSGQLMSGKWGSVLTHYWKVLTGEEQAAIKAGLREANRHNFHAVVMKTILTEPRMEEENLYAQAARKIQGQGVYDPKQSATSSNRISLSEYMQNNMLKSHL